MILKVPLGRIIKNESPAVYGQTFFQLVVLYTICYYLSKEFLSSFIPGPIVLEMTMELM